MKKILFIAYYYPPIKSGGGQRPINFIKVFKKNDFEVTLLTSTYKPSKFSSDIIRVIDISFNMNRSGLKKIVWLLFRVFTEIKIKLGLYHSIYSWWKNSIIKKSEKIIDLVKPDVIFVTYPPVETLEIGMYISNKFNIPLISDFRDGLLFEPIERKLLEKSRTVKAYYTKLEREIIMNSSYITTVSEPITDYFKLKYNTRNVLTVYTGFNIEEVKNLPLTDYLDKNKFNIVFTGRLNLSDSSNRTGIFFKAVSELVNENVDIREIIRIYFAGEFSKNEFAQFSNLIETGVFKNLGFLNRKSVLALQKKSDLLLIITSIERSGIVTSKIFEYLMSGTPILSLTFGTELEKIINKTKIGWNLHPNDINGIKMFIQRIVSDKNFYHSLMPDRKMIDELSAEVQIKKILSIL